MPLFSSNERMNVSGSLPSFPELSGYLLPRRYEEPQVPSRETQDPVFAHMIKSYAALWHGHWQFLRLSLAKPEQLPGILLPRRVPEYIVARAVVSRSHGDTRIPRVFNIANPRSMSLLPER